VREEAERFLQGLLDAVRGFPHLAYWNLWQEISLAMVNPGASGPDRNVPFNPETLASFREWLRKKHGSLDALNAAWKTRFPSWESVEPPRLYTKVPSFMDWRRFIHEEYLTRVLKERKQVVKGQGGGASRIAFHTCHPLFGAAWESAWSGLADYYGTSFYPTAQLYHGWEHPDGQLDEAEDRRHELWSSLYHLNYGRCMVSGRTRYLISEMACGPYNMGLNVMGEVARDDLRRWLLLQIAAGSQGVVLWNTRPEIFWDEAQGQGFLDGDGNPTPRAEAIREFGEAVKSHSDLLANSTKPPSPVGIVVDDDTSSFLEGSDAGVHANMPLRGVYEALLSLGVDPDFVDIGRVTVEGLCSRKVLFMPFPVAMAERTVRKLAAWVEAGGFLVSGPTPARFSEFGWAYQRGMPPEVERLFGVRQESLRQVAEKSRPWRWTPRPSRAGDLLPPTDLLGCGEFSSLALKASFYLQSFRLEGAERLLAATLDDGRECTVGTVQRLGKGRAYLIGTMFAYSSLSEGCSGTRSAIARLMDSAGVHVERQGEIIPQRRACGSAALLALINLGDKDAEWHFSESDSGFQDLLTREAFVPGSAAIVPRFDLRAFVTPPQANSR